MTAALDDLDRKILTALQHDADRPLEEIARAVGSSKTPVWNRIRKLKAAGVIRATVAVVDAEAVGLESCFFVLVRAAAHDAEWMTRFVALIHARPEIIEAHRLAGDVDYILKVRASGPRAYDAFYREMVSALSFQNVTSALSMEEIKAGAALPVAEAGEAG